MQFRHKLYPSPLILTNHGPALFANYEFETDDEQISAELAGNEDIEVLEDPPVSEPPPPAKKPRRVRKADS